MSDSQAPAQDAHSGEVEEIKVRSTNPGVLVPTRNKSTWESLVLPVSICYMHGIVSNSLTH